MRPVQARQIASTVSSRFALRDKGGTSFFHLVLLETQGLRRERLDCRVSRECLAVKPVREPDAGNPQARFDERRCETELWWRLRHRHPGEAAGNSYSISMTSRACRRALPSVECICPATNTRHKIEKLLASGSSSDSFWRSRTVMERCTAGRIVCAIRPRSLPCTESRGDHRR
jgi:hypothetical protein